MDKEEYFYQKGYTKGFYEKNKLTIPPIIIQSDCTIDFEKTRDIGKHQDIIFMKNKESEKN